MEKINFVNNSAPALNATNLNKLQDNIEDSMKSEQTTSDTDTYSCNYINSIIETGTNSDGSWIKYKDGTMICYITKEYNNINVINEWGSVYESDRIQLGNFPQQFINTPTVTANCVGGSTVFLESLSPTNTSIGETWFMRPVSQSNISPKISFIAIGKWK